MRALLLLCVIGACAFFFFSYSIGGASYEKLYGKVYNEAIFMEMADTLHNIKWKMDTVDSTYKLFFDGLKFDSSKDYNLSKEARRTLLNMIKEDLDSTEVQNNVLYIQKIVDEYDSAKYMWLLDTLTIDADRVLFRSSGPDITVCLDTSLAYADKKETILLFPEKVAQNTEYIIESPSWCTEIKVKIEKDLIGKKNTCVFSFAGIYDYTDSLNAEYIHGGSVCKIKIKY